MFWSRSKQEIWWFANSEVCTAWVRDTPTAKLSFSLCVNLSKHQCRCTDETIRWQQDHIEIRNTWDLQFSCSNPIRIKVKSNILATYWLNSTLYSSKTMKSHQVLLLLHVIQYWSRSSEAESSIDHFSDGVDLMHSESHGRKHQRIIQKYSKKWYTKPQYHQVKQPQWPVFRKKSRGYSKHSWNCYKKRSMEIIHVSVIKLSIEWNEEEENGTVYV